MRIASFESVCLWDKHSEQGIPLSYKFQSILKVRYIFWGKNKKSVHAFFWGKRVFLGKMFFVEIQHIFFNAKTTVYMFFLTSKKVSLKKKYIKKNQIWEKNSKIISFWGKKKRIKKIIRKMN